MSETKPESTRQIMDSELQRRLDIYNKECKPGSEDSPIKPMTFKQFLPALIISIIFTLYVVFGMLVVFPASYPGY